MPVSNKDQLAPRFYSSIQALRAVAALMVVAFHMYTMTAKYFSPSAEAVNLAFFGSSGVDLFFVISGFVMVSIAGRYFAHAGSVREFLMKRALRILPLYWFFGLLMLALFLLAPNLFSSQVGALVNPSSLFTSLTLIPTGQTPLLAQGWTLSFEMFFYVVFAALLAFGSRAVLPGLLVLWAVITVAAGHVAGLIHVSSAVIRPCIDPLTLEFIAGCFAGLFVDKLNKRSATATLMIGLIAYGVTLVCIATMKSEIIGSGRALWFGAPAFFVVLGAAACERLSGSWVPTWLVAMGNASYSIYLSHILAIFAFWKTWTMLPVVLDVQRSVGLMLCLIFTVAVGALSYRCIELPLARLTKRAIPSLRRSPTMSAST